MDIFATVNLSVPPRKTMWTYGYVGVWIVAIVFLILAWINADNAANVQKQKNYNLYVVITLLAFVFQFLCLLPMLYY